MFSKIVALCAVVAVSQAGLLPAAVHYSSAAAVSSQNIVRHDESRVAGIAAPVAYRAAPVAYRAAPAVALAAPVAYNAAPVAYRAAPIAYSAAPIAARQADEYAHPKYEYNYSVADAHTGDNKQQQEVRDGDVVRGSYSFHEADGSVRTVEYSADAHSGFNAVVHNTAPTAAPAIIRAAPAVYAAPAANYYNH